MRGILASPNKPLYPFVLNRGSGQSRGLVGWWPGGPSGGPKLYDMSGRNDHGTLTAGPTWNAGKGGGRGALLFNGSTSVLLASEITLATTFTFSAWCTLSVTNSCMAGASSESATLLFYTQMAGTTQLRDSGPGQAQRSYTIPATPASPQFFMLTATRDASNNARVYFNGTESVTGAQSLSETLRLGTIGAFGFASFRWNGNVEDARLYNRCLTAAEVYALWHPATRWQLRYQPRLVKYSFASVSTAIAFDAASNSGYQTAQSSYSWSHTCTGSNRFLAVDVSLLSVPGTTVTSITYNGVALSLIGARSTVSGAGRAECWGLVNPASGSNTIAVTLSASVASAGTAVSYTNIHQTSPTEAFNSAQATNVGAADATVNVTTVADNDWVHGAVATDDASVTAGQTSRNNVTGALGSGADEDTGPVSPAGSTAISYTGVGALATWAIAGYALRPISASGLGNRRRRYLIAGRY